MDNVTHALAGLLLADATVAVIERDGRRAVTPALRRSAALIGVVSAEAPDLDLLYSGPVLGLGKLGYLLHHRGHTHTVVAALGLALLLWALVVAWGRRRAADGSVRAAAVPLLGLALAGALSHIALDWTNSYGVHPYWPFDNAWRYGDAVFIVEPWLWLVGAGALLAGRRWNVARVLLWLAQIAIVVAAFALPFVAREVALALAAFGAAWWWTCRRLPVGGRLALAVLAWGAVELAGVTASTRSAEVVATAMAASIAGGEWVHDVVLTPAPADPRCFDALVVSFDGPRYRVTSAVVAPYPAWRDAADCAGLGLDGRRVPAPGSGLGARLVPSSRGDTPAVAWLREWRAPIAELRALAAGHCGVAAALRFMRVPVWATVAGSLRLSDLRYGFGGGGFADLALPVEPDDAYCARLVPPRLPPWEPPVGALLEAD